MLTPIRTMTRALVIGALPLLAATASAQRATAPVDRPRRDPDPAVRLPKPEGLALTQLSATTVRLTWHTVARAKGYILGRSIGTNGFQRINIPLVPQTEYTDTEVRVGVRVSYSVTPVDSGDLAGLRAISADFVPVAMAPEPVATVDSTASDSTRTDSSAAGGSTGGGSTPGGSSSSGSGPSRMPLKVSCSLPSMGSPPSLYRSDPRTSPSIKVESRFAKPVIAVEWRPSERDRISERSGWEIWDQINETEHFVARVPAGTRQFAINVGRAGTHLPMIFPSNDEGFLYPVCGMPLRVTDEMLTAPGGSAPAGSAPSSASPSAAASSDARIEVGAPIQVEVRKTADVAHKTLAQQWVSLDPDIAILERGAVVGVAPGEARLVGITGNTDGTIRLNLVRVTVTAAPSPRHR